MNQIILFFIGIILLMLGAILGYYARQSIAKKNYRTIEAKLEKKILNAKEEAERILLEAKQKSNQIVVSSQKEIDEKHQKLQKLEKILLKREDILAEKNYDFEIKEKELHKKIEQIKEIKNSVESLKQEVSNQLEKISNFSKEDARKELLNNVEKEYQKDILERIKKIESEGQQKIDRKAKEILTLAIQRIAISQVQEVTTSPVILPNEEIKGRIIGKEGRNIRALEKASGAEIVIDETPDAVLVSSFDPIRRQIAKISLEKLIKDGRIQPTRIEEIVQQTQSEINQQIKEIGETTVYEVGILNLHQKIIQLLGRLHFRTSYGQNVLLHSTEVAYLAEGIALELKADSRVAKKAGLLHDIGKSVDQQIEGSHVDIGIKILEKFGVEPEVITAMKSHHEEYPYETLEAIIVQTADAISGARPGARKDTLENYMKRLKDLEDIALGFTGVEKAYAIAAGREIRVFVKPEEIDDLMSKKLAKEIANSIEEELRYPGEIKVVVIRESRIVEYAK